MISERPDSDTLQSVIALIRSRFGIQTPRYRESVVSATLTRLAADQNIGVSQLAEKLLDQDAQLLLQLIDQLVIPESHFFRHPLDFEFVRDEVLPALLGKKNHIRVWSAGCSTGQEPYSLAILFHQLGCHDRVSILASDISNQALTIAKAGVYGRWALRGVDYWPDCNRYLVSAGSGQQQIIQPIRDMVTFNRMNLLDFAAYPTGFDLVFCRNVGIYMTGIAYDRMMTAQLASLNAGGWLVPGPSDPAVNKPRNTTQVIAAGGVKYQATTTPSLRSHTADQSESVPTKHPPIPGDGSELLKSSRPAGSRHASYDDASENIPEHSIASIHALMDNEKYESALAMIDVCLAKNPDQTEPRYLRALINLRQGRLEQANASIRDILYLDRTLPVAHLTQGIVMMQQGQLAEAHRSFLEAARLAGCQPDEADTLFAEQSAGAIADAATRYAERVAALLGGPDA